MSSFQMADALLVMWCNLSPFFCHWRRFPGPASPRDGQSVFLHLNVEDHWDIMWSAVKGVRDVCCSELLQMFGREEFVISYRVFTVYCVCDVLRGSGSHVCVFVCWRRWGSGRGGCVCSCICVCGSFRGLAWSFMALCGKTAHFVSILNLSLSI